MFLQPDTQVLSRERVTVWETASLLRPFNVWRTLVGRKTMLLVPVIEGKYIWVWYKS